MSERLFIGSGEGRIHVFTFDGPGSQKAPTPLGSFEAGDNPSYLAFHPTEPVLYAVDETSPGRARAFTVDDRDRDVQLVPLSETPSGGDGPAHLSLDHTGRVLLLSNYGSGTVTAAHVHEDGSIAEPTSPPRNSGEKAHQIRVDRTNRWVFVPCLGTDEIVQYRLDATHARLEDSPNAPLKSEKGSGPRHLDFHPSRRFLWVVHEFGNTVTGYAFDEGTGACDKLQAVPILPSDFHGRSDGGGILVHPDGGWLFATNRGHDSVVTFRINPGTGMLSIVGHTLCGGRHPRHLTLSPDGRALLVANLHSNGVQAFSFDESDGRLTPTWSLDVPKPAFVGVRDLVHNRGP